MLAVTLARFLPVASSTSVCDTENSYNLISEGILRLCLRLYNLDWNQNLKYSWQEKNETEKADSDADPAGEGVHVQAAIICEVILLICNCFPPEMPLQIFLAAAKGGDSCLYGRAQHKANGLQVRVKSGSSKG